MLFKPVPAWPGDMPEPKAKSVEWVGPEGPRECPHILLTLPGKAHWRLGAVHRGIKVRCELCGSVLTADVTIEAAK